LEQEQIAIRPPEVDGQVLALNSGTKIILRNTRTGSRRPFNSLIKAFDVEDETLNVHYTQEARIIHSEKTFSVSVYPSIPLKILDPTASGSQEPYEGTIMEISSVWMSVYCMEDVPVNKCLALKFELPDGTEVSTPLVTARQGESDFLYDIEFAVLDEKERSNIIQYMYQRQIEDKKSEK
jgi:hypothetical protein